MGFAVYIFFEIISITFQHPWLQREMRESYGIFVRFSFYFFEYFFEYDSSFRTRRYFTQSFPTLLQGPVLSLRGTEYYFLWQSLHLTPHECLIVDCRYVFVVFSFWLILIFRLLEQFENALISICFRVSPEFLHDVKSPSLVKKPLERRCLSPCLLHMT